MNQEEKDLLLKDLSARLPYGVKCKYPDFNIDGALEVISKDKVTLHGNDSYWHSCDIANIKPYLFPLSSMTKEQIKEFNSLSDLEIDGVPGHTEYYINPTICSKGRMGFEGEFVSIEITQDDIIPVIDWLNAHHFDFRYLLEKGLAIDATGLNIY